MSIESLSDKAKRFYVTQAEIDATHPMNDGVTCYAEDEAAMQLVGERHGKRDLVNLVRTLIIRAKPLRGVETSGWQPIATAPKNGKRILVSEYSGYVHLVQWCSAGYWRNRTDDGDLEWSPVLWMPFEEPPELSIEEARAAIAISRAIPVYPSAPAVKP